MSSFPFNSGATKKKKIVEKFLKLVEGSEKSPWKVTNGKKNVRKWSEMFKKWSKVLETDLKILEPQIWSKR